MDLMVSICIDINNLNGLKCLKRRSFKRGG